MCKIVCTKPHCLLLSYFVHSKDSFINFKKKKNLEEFNSPSTNGHSEKLKCLLTQKTLFFFFVSGPAETHTQRPPRPHVPPAGADSARVSGRDAE